MLGSANYLGSNECRQIKEVKALCANLYKYSPTPIGKTSYFNSKKPTEIHHLFFYTGQGGEMVCKDSTTCNRLFWQYLMHNGIKMEAQELINQSLINFDAEVKSAARQIKENRQARREYLENLVKKISKKTEGDKNRQKIGKTAIEADDGTNST